MKPFNAARYLQQLGAPPAGPAILASVLHADGANNGAFVDSTGKVWHAINSGFPRLSTTTPWQGNATGLFSDVYPGGILASQYHEDFGLGTGDFTVRFRARWASFTTVQHTLWSNRNGNTDPGLALVQNGSGQFLFYDENSDPSVDSGAAVAANTYHDIVIERYAGNLYLYINGVIRIGPISDTRNYGSARCVAWGDDAGSNPSAPTGARMDDMVIVKGQGIYGGANFTPPTTHYVAAPASTHWRVQFSDAQSGGKVSVAEIQLRQTPGNINAATGGTPSATSADTGQPVTNAFDANNATVHGSVSGTWPHNVTYVFATAVNIEQLAIISTDATYNQHLTQAPKNFKVQQSLDGGSSWIDRYVAPAQAAWTATLTRTFDIPQPALVAAPAGVEPSFYSGLTFWYDGDRSPHFISDSTSNGIKLINGPVARIDSMTAAILRSLGGSGNTELVTELIAGHMGINTFGGGMAMWVKPTTTASFATPINYSTLFSTTNKGAVFLLRVIDAGTDQYIPGPGNESTLYLNGAIFYNNGGPFGITVHRSGSNITFRAINATTTPVYSFAEWTVTGGLNTWMVVSVIHRSSRMIIRVNGVEVANVASGTSAALSQSFSLAAAIEIDLTDMALYNVSRTDAEYLEVERRFGVKAALTF